MKKKILILNTGGTISSVKTQHGYAPQSGHVEATLAQISALSHDDLPTYDIKEYQPLLDSANITVNEWNRLANDIAMEYNHYDGFIIFHGTDTMAYTASALSFMFENLGKPVILTGSQIPLSAVRSDALDNVLTSLWLCAHQPINEVCIYFNQRLLRGNRSQKIYEQQFNAFDSPNYPHLATIGIQIKLHSKRLLPPPTDAFRVQKMEEHLIANLRLFPGFSTDVLAALLQQPLRGLVLETYGSGNAPNNDPRFLQLLTEASARGVIIVNSTQCQQGSVSMSQYATGYTLIQAGLISGGDMTPETIHSKLLYLLSKYKDIGFIKSAMQTNLCGELQADHLPPPGEGAICQIGGF